jgi:alpha-tubulin suppressor-like RCC1 family protein
LGLGNNEDVFVPTKVRALLPAENNNGDFQNNFKESILFSNEQVSSIACGALHTVVMTTKGRLFSAGYGETYALGNGT